ncbi:MAG: hypothetical protein PHV28_04035, partial [Kiritimatiellae bacterium]|nr:hypothetical protein [Kiritimatiellia bacterium]
PAQFAHEALVDFYGNPRVLGGAVDVGAVEYDWRKDFAYDLTGLVTVVSAGAGVVETSAKNVRLSDSDAVTVRMSEELKHVRRRFDFTVSSGTLTIKMGGATVATFISGGSWINPGEAGGEEIEFSFEASGESGYADLLETGSTKGFLIIFR